MELLVSRELYSLNKDSFGSKTNRVVFYSLLVFLFCTFLRSFSNYIYPNLYIEDTTHYFNYFYGNVRGLESILHGPNGYLNILNNIFGFCTAYFDVRLQPRIYVAIGTVCCTVACFIFSFSGIIKNRYLLFIVPFVLGFSGLNHIFYYVTLTYQIYVLVIILLALLFVEPLENKFLNIVFFLLLSLLIWSGPYSVLVVPTAFCFILSFKGRSKFMLGLIVVTLLYTSTVAENTIWLHNIFNPAVRELWASLFFSKIVCMDIAGSYSHKMVAIVFFLFAITLGLLKDDSFYLKIAFIVFVIINGALGSYLLSKKIALYLRVLPCHLVIAQFFWLFLVIFTFDRLIKKYQFFQRLVPFIAVCLVVFVCYDNFKHHDKWSFPIMEKLPQYLEAVHEAESLPLKRENKQKAFIYAEKMFVPQNKVGVVPAREDTSIEEIIFIKNK